VSSKTKSQPLTMMIALVLSIIAFQPSALRQGMTTGIMSPPANVRPPGLKNVGIEQNLNQPIPGDLQFTDDLGRLVRLGDYFGKKPMILNLVYYNCPMLCGEVLSGLEHSLRMMKFDVGKEFDVITVSFDSSETAFRNDQDRPSGGCDFARWRRNSQFPFYRKEPRRILSDSEKVRRDLLGLFRDLCRLRI